MRTNRRGALMWELMWWIHSQSIWFGFTALTLSNSWIFRIWAFDCGLLNCLESKLLIDPVIRRRWDSLGSQKGGCSCPKSPTKASFLIIRLWMIYIWIYDLWLYGSMIYYVCWFWDSEKEVPGFWPTTQNHMWSSIATGCNGNHTCVPSKLKTRRWNRSNKRQMVFLPDIYMFLGFQPQPQKFKVANGVDWSSNCTMCSPMMGLSLLFRRRIKIVWYVEAPKVSLPSYPIVGQSSQSHISKLSKLLALIGIRPCCGVWKRSREALFGRTPRFNQWSSIIDFGNGPTQDTGSG